MRISGIVVAVLVGSAVAERLARKLDQNAAANAMSLLDQAYKLFVSLNNKFVADGLKGQRRASDTPAVSRHGVPDEGGPAEALEP